MSKTMSITNVRKDLYKVVADVCNVHEDVLVYNAKTGQNAVIISEDDWNSIKESLYLNSVPGLAKSILDAKNEPLSDGTIYNSEEEW